MTTLFQDLRYALRSLRKTPGFTVVVLVVLALGIGANSAIFSVVNAVLLRPLPYAEPERLFELSETVGSSTGIPVSYPNFIDWHQDNRVFESMGIAAPMPQALNRSTGAERVTVTLVSSGFFRAYGVRPRLGRGFANAEHKANGEAVVLLTDAAWKNRFGADAAIVGRTISLDAKPHTVIGVLPPFRYYRGGDMFTPIEPLADKYNMLMRSNHNNTRVTARVKPGETLASARAQMNTIAARLAREYPAENAGRSIEVTPLRDIMAGNMHESVLVMLGAVGLVLLAACANVANLLLARATARRREIAIRAAIGASKRHIVQQLLVESVVLGVAGAALGLVAARFTFDGLLYLFPGAESLGGIGIDGRVLGFTFLAALVTALLFGMIPALQTARLNLGGAIKEGSVDMGARLGRMPLRKVLVVAEVALAVVLLVGAGLLMRSLERLLSVDPGFRPEGVLTAQVRLTDDSKGDVGTSPRIWENISRSLSEAPGVTHAGAVNTLPLAGTSSSIIFYVEGKPLPEKGKFPAALHREAMPGYFQALGIPLLKGRLFTPQDGRIVSLKRDMKVMIEWLRKEEFKAVINETMARQFWPNEDPLGKRFRFGDPNFNGPWISVIGVVGDERHYSLNAPPQAGFYLSAYHFPSPYMTFVVRTAGDPMTVAGSIRRLVANVDPNAVVTDIRPMREVVSKSVAPAMTNMALLGIFAALALVLAAVGAYGFMAYLVSQRSREFGIRMALGAGSKEVQRMVVREGAVLGGTGVLIGLAVAFLLAHVIASMLYGVTSRDAVTYSAASVVLLAAMLAASYVPARRATRVNPVTALRCE